MEREKNMKRRNRINFLLWTLLADPTWHRAYLRWTEGGPNPMANNESTGHDTTLFTTELFYLAVGCALLLAVDWFKDLIRRTFLSESIVMDPKIMGKGKN
jgi:hypothetical protein